MESQNLKSKRDCLVLLHHYMIKKRKEVQGGHVMADTNSVIEILKKNFFKVSQPLCPRLSWLEHCPVNQKVAGSVPSQAHTRGNQSMFLSNIDVSLPLSFSLPSLYSKISKHTLWRGQKKKKLKQCKCCFRQVPLHYQ